jgi:hypothetical protein
VDNHLQVSECISTPGMTYGFLPILSVEKTKSFPPEIRDQIYDLIYQESEETTREWHYKIRATSTKVRLINQQFKFEYDKQSKRSAINSFVEISECDLVNFNCPCFDGAFSLPSSLATWTTHLHINLISCQEVPVCYDLSDVFSCKCRDRFTHWYIFYLERFTRSFPLLKNITVNVSCGSLKSTIALRDEVWPTIPNVSRISLLNPADFYMDDMLESYVGRGRTGEVELHPHGASRFFECDHETVATWKPTQGWQTDVKAVEECRKEEAAWLENSEQAIE